MEKKLTKEVTDFIKSLDTSKMKLGQIIKALEKEFGLDVHRTTIQRYLTKNNIKYLRKDIWTDEINQFVTEKSKEKISSQDIANLTNQKFGTHFTKEAMRHHICNTLGIHRNFNAGSFKKGRIPYNKGVKGVVHLVHSGSFKKGNIPPNVLPIGSEQKRRCGDYCFTYVKIAQPSTWITKQRYLYQKYHNVELTKKDRVIFKNEDHNDYSIENLALVEEGDIGVLNLMKYNSTDIKTKEAQIANAKLIRVIAKKRKELEERDK